VGELRGVWDLTAPDRLRLSTLIVARSRSPRIKAIAGTVTIFVSMSLEKGSVKGGHRSPDAQAIPNGV